MKTSTEIASIKKLTGEEKAIELLAKAGFDAWDFSMSDMARYDWSNKCIIKSGHPLAGDNYLAFARKLKQIGLDSGIVCNQSHAPVPSYIREIRSFYKRAIECTAEAGGEICVIHPDNFKGPEENAEIYLELLPFAKEYNVKIATENMWDWDNEKDEAKINACSTPEDFNAHLDAVNDESFVACLDIGHSEMRGLNTSAVEMILKLGKRLKALHIHDNDRWRDYHQLPFTMNINFEAVVKALKEINYDGYFTLEAYSFLNDYTSENVFEGVKKMADAARRLAVMFENV